MSGRRRIVPALLLAIGPALSAPLHADRLQSPINVRVNQDQSGNAQFETTMAADPRDPSRLVAGWFERVFGPPQFPNFFLNTAWSKDGGLTWHSQRLDTGLGQNFDPTMAVDSQGNFYFEAAGAETDSNGFVTQFHLRIYKSTDGGQSFFQTAEIPVLKFLDKPFLIVEPQTDAIDTVWADILTPGKLDFDIFFARSTDHGATFSAPVRLSDSSTLGSAAMPAVGPSGEIYVTWGNNDNKIWFNRSLDAGVTWLPKAQSIIGMIKRAPQILAPHVLNPLIPVLAVDLSSRPHRGRLYLVWEDGRFADPDILVAFSDDRGDTWSDPVRANDDAVGTGAEQFIPWVNIDDQGRVLVTFLDHRLTTGSQFLYAMYLATSTDGGSSFGPNVRVSDGLYPPSTDYFGIGDYNQAAVAGGRIHPIWADARFSDLDIFTESLDLLDYDGDGVLNDGDGDGQYADNRCTGGQRLGCDDNCPGTPNPQQADTDGDRVGDVCDNCPGVYNPDQSDLDRDGLGDACDPTPTPP